ncbi:MAG: hypothetical protein COB14_05930 [Alphaproteobacteria bacterium]|nr:MAG: hypothetical protein COB14_05930 [Alphaproteobacteria bacterium]
MSEENISNNELALSSMLSVLKIAQEDPQTVNLFKKTLDIDINKILDDNTVTQQEALQITLTMGNALIKNGIVSEPSNNDIEVAKTLAQDQGFDTKGLEESDLNGFTAAVLAGPDEAVLLMEKMSEVYCDNSSNKEGLCAKFEIEALQPENTPERDMTTGEPTATEQQDIDIKTPLLPLLSPPNGNYIVSLKLTQLQFIKNKSKAGKYLQPFFMPTPILNANDYMPHSNRLHVSQGRCIISYALIIRMRRLLLTTLLRNFI